MTDENLKNSMILAITELTPDTNNLVKKALKLKNKLFCLFLMFFLHVYLLFTNTFSLSK